MYGVLTTIPLMVAISVFYIIAFLIIRGDFFGRANQETRKLQLTMAAALIIGSCAPFLAIANGILYDLFPQDLYIPLIVDRFTIISGYLGTHIIAVVDVFFLVRYHVIYNITEKSAKFFGYGVVALLSLTTFPLFVEATMFASGYIPHDKRVYDIIRYISFVGALAFIIFTLWYFISLAKNLYNLSLKKQTRDKNRSFEKLIVFLLTSAIFTLLCDVFFFLSIIVEYRSKEYLLYLHMSGASIAFCVISHLFLKMNMYTFMVTIIHNSGEQAMQVGSSVTWTRAQSLKKGIPLRAYAKKPQVDHPTVIVKRESLNSP